MVPKTFSTSTTSILSPLSPSQQSIMSTEALLFIEALHRRFNSRRKKLLIKRAQRTKRLAVGEKPDFLQETSSIRAGAWQIAPVPEDLQDRRVEITGPVDRKMIINALNSGAKVFMADLEDSNSPTFDNILNGQVNLRDAVAGTISFYDPQKEKQYELNQKTATLMVRPRGWHLEEKYLECDGEPMSGSLVDFGLYFFHNAKALTDKGSGPYFYLPKLESHLEARLWNDVFVFAQSWLGLPLGTIKATVLVETILASFELDEILYELRDHSAGLNCGRWDYIFSYLKKFGHDPAFLVPDRAQVTMTSPFMQAYSHLAIETCHKRGAHAMGGMAAQIPVRGDEAANEKAFDKIRADKLREAKDGHDGTWVAHPGLVPVAMEVFNEYMPQANQIHKRIPTLSISANDLLEVPQGSITEHGVRTNIDVGIRYLAAWLSGSGCVPIYHLMEDAATAEISRTQLWQWVHLPEVYMEDGREVTEELFLTFFSEQVDLLRKETGTERFLAENFKLASSIFEQLTLKEDLEEFLTLEGYEYL